MSDHEDLKAVRREYFGEELDLGGIAADPCEQFRRWLNQHREQDSINATTMVLATAAADGCPSARVVLLKHFDSQGFCWYTDYRSQKGRELGENPQAELLFYWPELERQVRVWGRVERLDRDAAESYFAERPLGSKLSAAASVQSAVVTSRQALEQKVVELAERCQGGDVPCPEQWGGYRLIPERYEFWQGRENRLHDRLVYSQQLDGWHIVRLSP